MIKDIRLKIRYVYWPFLVIASSVLIGYTFINWLLVVKLDLFKLKDILVDFAFPISLAWLASYIWLRPKIKLLNLMGKKGDDRLYFIYQILAVIIIATPLVITQDYLKVSTGKMVQLNTINEIKSQEYAKFYQVNTFYIDKSKASIETSFVVTGRGFNKNLKMNIFLALPMYDYATDALYSTLPPAAWYGLTFTDQVANSLSTEEKEAAFQKFLSDTETSLDWLDLSDFTYLQREGNTSNYDEFETAVRKSQTPKSNSEPIILTPKKGRLDDSLGNSLGWIMFYLFGGFGLFLVMIAIPRVDKSALIHIRNQKRNLIKESLRTFFGPLVPSSGFKIIPILIFINILIFLLMAILHESFMIFDVDTLISWGGSSQTLVLAHKEWWRLLANTFVHSGFIHLLMNMVTLYLVGLIVEPILGSRYTLLVYLLTAIGASVVSIFFNKFSISVGASGAIMGMCGLFGALLLTGVFSKEAARYLGIYLIIFILYNLLIGFSGDIDNAAHIGGLITGFILGIIFRFMPRKDRNKRLNKSNTPL